MAFGEMLLAGTASGPERSILPTWLALPGWYTLPSHGANPVIKIWLCLIHELFQHF